MVLFFFGLTEQIFNTVLHKENVFFQQTPASIYIFTFFKHSKTGINRSVTLQILYESFRQLNMYIQVFNPLGDQSIQGK